MKTNCCQNNLLVVVAALGTAAITAVGMLVAPKLTPFFAATFAGAGTYLACKRIKQPVQMLTPQSKQMKTLIEMNSSLRESVRSKDAFLRVLSSDLRSPLTSICGAVDLVKDTNLSAEQKEYVSLIGEALVQITAVADDARDIWKLENGRFIVKREPINIRRIARDMISRYESSCVRRGIGLYLHLGTEVPHRIISDDGVMQRICSSILEYAEQNAVSASNISMSIDGSQKEDNKVNLEISVKANLSRDMKNGLNFANGNSNASLLFIEKMAGLFGGSLTTQNIDGITQIRVTLPCSYMISADDILSDAGTEIAAQAKALKILVVDDMPSNLRIASLLLEKMGHEVKLASSGKEAVLVSEAEEFDLILMDVHMPDMDGLDATKVIREREKSGKRRIPIIGLTGIVASSDDTELSDAGMDAVLPKPIHNQDLAKALQRATTVTQ